MIFRLMGFGLALLAAGCKPPPPEPVQPTPTPAREEVRIGLLLPLTGSQASFGADAKLGAELAAEAVNADGGLLGRDLALDIQDTGSASEGIEEKIGKFAADGKVPVVVGEVASSRTLEAAAAAQARALPFVAPAATHPGVTETGEFIFRTCYAEPAQGEAMARFALSIGAGRAAVLTAADDPYSAGLAESFRAAFTREGGEIVGDLPAQADSIDQLKTLNADVVFLPVYFLDAASIIQKARASGIEVPFLGGDGWDSPEFLALGGEAVHNCYAANHFSAAKPEPTVAAFAARFQDRFGKPPPPLAALAYDAIKVAALAISSVGSLNRDAVRDALAQTRDFQGVTGSISLDNSRTPQKPVVILRVQDGAFTYLETINP